MNKWWLIGGLSVLIWACNDEPKSDNVKEVSEGVQVEQVVDSIDILNEMIKKEPKNASLYAQKARIYLTQQQSDLAIEEYERAIKADTTDPTYYLKKAEVFFNRAQFDKSRKETERVLAFAPENAQANLRMAWIAFVVKGYEKSLEYINEALKADVHLAEAYYLKGLVYKDTEKYKMAVSSFRTATEQDNNYYEAWVELGYLHGLANSDLTTSYYDNAIRIDSTKYEAHYNKGFFLQERGRYREALDEYDVIIRNKPYFYNAYYNKGFIYLEYLEKYDSAAYEFTRVIGVNPMNFKAFYNRGLAYERDGEDKKALQDYEEALKLKPTFDLAAEGKSRVLGN